MMKNAIEIRGLKKEYSDFSLTINAEIPKGTIVGLIGENGAGKSTLIKAILSIIHTQGSIKIFGKDHALDENVVKEDIGVVLDNMFFPELLMVKDISSVMKSIYKNWDGELFEKYLNDFKISHKQSLKTLSKGMRKKLEIATALAHHPKLLILDEPTSGLDPVVRKEVLDLFLDFIQDEEHTILISTHITGDLEYIADYIMFIADGKKIVSLPRDEISDNYGILKCSLSEFGTIDSTDIVSYIKNRYDYHILVKDVSKIRSKYKNYIIDKITIEDFMLLMIKGVK